MRSTPQAVPWVRRLPWLAVATLCLACTQAERPKRDILLVTVDTLRADFLHSYGFSAAITPELDALARRGVRFDYAIAASSATAPAVASIMTSRYPREHTVGTLNGPTRLTGGRTLAEQLRAAGWDTGAFISNVVLKRRSGFDRGFEVFDDELPHSETHRIAYFERDAKGTVDRALAWLAARRERPVFLWVHLQDPHGPYEPPPGFAPAEARFPLRTDRPLSAMAGNRGRAGIPAYQVQPALSLPSEYARRYAGEVAFVDQQVGRLVAAFEARAPEGVIALTADHGESMGEDGFFFQHGHATTPELARVPLILVAPGAAAGDRDEPVSHVDLAPTLLELGGAPSLADARGVSLAPLLYGSGQLPERPLYCDVPGEVGVYSRGEYTRVWEGSPQAPKLAWRRYALAREGDPTTLEDGGRAEEADTLAREVRAYLDSATEVAPADAMSEDDVERLRALGYLPPEDEAALPR